MPFIVDSTVARWVIEQPAPRPGDTTRAWIATTPLLHRPSRLHLIQPADGTTWFATPDALCHGGRSVDHVVTAESAADVAVCVALTKREPTTLVVEVGDTTPAAARSATLVRSEPIDVGKQPPEENLKAIVFASAIGVIAALLGSIAQHFLAVRQDDKSADRKKKDDAWDLLKQVVADVELELSAHAVALQGVPSAPLTMKGAQLLLKKTVRDFLSSIGEAEYLDRLTAYYKTVAELNADWNDWQGTKANAATLQGEARQRLETAADAILARLKETAATLRANIPRDSRT